MAKRQPLLNYDPHAAQWVVHTCSAHVYRHCDSYDEALAEFLRQVELYRQPEPEPEPERKRLRAYLWHPVGRPHLITRYLPEGKKPESNWQRAPWLDEPEEG